MSSSRLSVGGKAVVAGLGTMLFLLLVCPVSGQETGRGGAQRGGFGRGVGPPAGPVLDFGTSGIELKPFVIDHRHASDSLVDLSFLHEGPAGKDGFIRVENGHFVTGSGKAIRFWGFNLTEWSRGSYEIPTKEDAPIYAAALARFGVNLVRLHFLDLPSPRGFIDSTADDSRHFDKELLDREDFFIAELLNRGIYIDFNLYVGRQFKNGDNLLTSTPPDANAAPARGRGGMRRGLIGKSELFFDKRGIELQKDYAKQWLTHVNPYTGRAYVDEPGMAIVELVNEASIDVGYSVNPAYSQELDEMYNAWLKKTQTPEKLARLHEIAGVSADQPMPRLTGQTVREAPKEQYYTECDFFHDLKTGFFRAMSDYLKGTLGVKCPVMGTADHSHSGSGYPITWANAAIDIIDGHDYWQHPSVNPGNSPMVNDPNNSTIVELARTAVAGKPYTVSEMGHPFPNQFAAEGMPILAAYGAFQGWDMIVWYTFEMKKNPNWAPYVGDAFDTSLDPVKMPQVAACALMYLRGDIEPARRTITRTYTRQQVWDSRLLPRTERSWFTPGYPITTPLLHGVRVGSFDGAPTQIPTGISTTPPFKTDTGQLVWDVGPDQKNGIVTIDSPRSQALVGFVRDSDKSVTNLAADVKNDFCTIMVNSLEDKPIAAAGKLLLTAAVRVENTGMQWDARRMRPTRSGGAPTLIEPVTGTITLKNLDQATALSVQPLDGSARALGQPIPARKTPAGWQIPVGEPVTTWYLVNVQR
jgi:hypothetical protein